MVGEGFEPSKAVASRFTVCPRWPLGYPTGSGGTYYARVKVRGKIIRQSLDTNVFTTAKLKLLDFTKAKRATVDATETPAFSRAVELYEALLDADPRMKPSSKDYSRLCIHKLRSTWPDLWTFRLAEITEDDCRSWAARLRADIAAQYFNNVVGTLRLIIETGLKDHLKSGGVPLPNPAMSIAKARIPTKTLELPERDQFRAMVKDIRNGSSWGSKSADMIEFLAYSGLRLYTEAQHVTWEDIDWQRRELIVRGSPETATKNWDIRRIPLLPDMETSLPCVTQEPLDLENCVDVRRSAATPHHCTVIFLVDSQLLP